MAVLVAVCLLFSGAKPFIVVLFYLMLLILTLFDLYLWTTISFCLPVCFSRT